MLTPDDIKSIGVELGKVIEHNITPALDGLHTQIGSINTQIDGLHTQIGEIRSQMVTKSYLDDKLAELEGTVIVRQRKEDQKVNLLIDLLQRKSILAETDIRQLKEIQVFPTHTE